MRQVASSESYFIPRIPLVYLANLSINHVSEEATHFLKHLCVAAELPTDPIDRFYANTLHEAIGFFGSKVINHKRKAATEIDFRYMLTHSADVGQLEQRSRVAAVHDCFTVAELEVQGRYVEATW